MSKELFLIRHAEADANNFDIRDIDRSLTPEGEIVASKVGRFMKMNEYKPEAILVSSALRTRQTAGFMVEQIDFDPSKIQEMEELYEASTRILLRVVNEINPALKSVAIVAHNPAISFLAEYLTGDIIGNVSPAGIIHLRYEGEWSAFSQNVVEFVAYTSPKEIE
ncbi:histidine phosphatase family protein [Reichenbachiella agarivorans]|uniref:Histidine phosphatase family protein n=1 Tax=Reichenbachiella agarivorans TaxID=2979464 RepID=A0ABY6CPC1_9BACT|nr:histidine phosphatase family protein [Reichenbachiella agarivorans]UXP32372.1 histidine phosphatase family protein [Reichenbachiella agarivorans]